MTSTEEVLFARSLVRVTTPVQPTVGAYSEGVLASITITPEGTCTATVTGITVDPLVVPASAWWSWFTSEVNTLGVGVGGVIGRRVALLSTAGRQFTIASTVGS